MGMGGALGFKGEKVVAITIFFRFRCMICSTVNQV